MDQKVVEAEAADIKEVRSILDELISNSKLYRTTDEFKQLLEFVTRLRNFAPFNALLLQIQKPGLTFAAPAAEWMGKFQRRPKDGARPLLIMWPFGPVALVYDVMDTEGKELPKDAELFYARGPITQRDIETFIKLLEKKGITTTFIDQGDSRAGSITKGNKIGKKKQPGSYTMTINGNHNPATQFVTISHELGHLFLGHLGPDEFFSILPRSVRSKDLQEFEAESVAYLLAKRNGVTSHSHSYLSEYVDVANHIDIFTIMRAAGQIEQVLNLGIPMSVKPEIVSKPKEMRAIL